MDKTPMPQRCQQQLTLTLTRWLHAPQRGKHMHGCKSPCVHSTPSHPPAKELKHVRYNNGFISVRNAWNDEDAQAVFNTLKMEPLITSTNLKCIASDLWWSGNPALKLTLLQRPKSPFCNSNYPSYHKYQNAQILESPSINLTIKIISAVLYSSVFHVLLF